MKQNLVFLLTILIGMFLICGAGYWISYRAATTELAAVKAADYPELEWLRREFRLSDTQFERAKELHLSFDKRCQQMCMELAQSQNRLHEIVSKSGALEPEVLAAMEEAVALKKRCRMATLQHMYEISSLMEPGQSARYREVVSRTVIVPGRLPHFDEHGEMRDHIINHSGKTKEMSTMHD